MRYRAAMPSDTSLTIVKRPEPKLQRCWGIYSPLKDQWLDVVFRTEQEAEKVLKAMLLSAREEDRAQRIRSTSSSR